MPAFLKIASAGFAATAITYGPARMGFGLFLPTFRAEFSFGAGTAGLIASLGFAGFFCGLLLAQFLLARTSPRLPVLCGALAALGGMAMVAAAPGLHWLTAGVFLATSSAGFSWAPFNTVVHRRISKDQRPVALSIISTGTTVGILGAGAAALALGVAGISWRMCWAAFAAAAALAVAWNAVALHRGGPGGTTAGSWRTLACARAMPLFAISLSYGITSAIYLSFAADRFAGQGAEGLGAQAAPGAVYIAYGAFGFAGLLTGQARRAAGLPLLLVLLMLASAGSFALAAGAPESWTGLVLSAGLQGVHVMMLSAVLAFWSERLFPDLPSYSFTVVLLALAAGSVIGPAGAGFFAESLGESAMFLAAAGLSVATAGLVLAAPIVDGPLSLEEGV